MLVFKYCWNCLRLSQWLVVTRGEYSIDSRLSSAHIDGAEQCYCSAHRVISALPSWRCSCVSGGGLSMNEKNREKKISVSDDGGLMIITLQRYCWLWLYRRWWCQRQQLFHHSATWRSWIAGQLTSRPTIWLPDCTLSLLLRPNLGSSPAQTSSSFSSTEHRYFLSLYFGHHCTGHCGSVVVIRVGLRYCHCASGTITIATETQQFIFSRTRPTTAAIDCAYLDASAVLVRCEPHSPMCECVCAGSTPKAKVGLVKHSDVLSPSHGRYN